MRRSNERNWKWYLWILLLSLTVMACGKQPDRGAETDMEVEMETETKTKIETETETATNEGTEDPEHPYKEISAVYTDDLSLLDHMEQTDHSYAYRDGRVYYRQYHKDSFEEAALWADYHPLADTDKDKEIVCVDADGEKTVLFSDKGYGDIYLIGERFYMTEMITQAKGDGDYIYSNVYSVDMQGQNRIEYGYGEIYYFDVDRKFLILKMDPEGDSVKSYCALNCMSGEMIPLNVDFCDDLTFWDYQDGWCYFDVHQEASEGICRVVAVSLEGEQKEIIALTSDHETESEYGYREELCEMGVVGDRIYIIFGGYAGTGHCFQGGEIITIKLDGSDYRSMEIESSDDAYYVCFDAGKPLVYIPQSWIEDEVEYETTVWDVESNTVFPSDFPWQLIYEQRTHSIWPYREHIAPRTLCALKDDGTNVYALPDDSGRIVRVAAKIDEAIEPRGDGEVDYINYQHLFYADGFLYFEVEFNIYEVECSIGWRDGYRRLQTDVYRLKLDGNVMELLYSY